MACSGGCLHSSWIRKSASAWCKEPSYSFRLGAASLFPKHHNPSGSALAPGDVDQLAEPVGTAAVHHMQVADGQVLLLYGGAFAACVPGHTLDHILLEGQGAIHRICRGMNTPAGTTDQGNKATADVSDNNLSFHLHHVRF